MLVVGFPALAFGTNCYVLAPSAGEECLVVDPGVGVQDHLDEVLAEHRLRPVAVLLTHGHLDHTFAVAPVCAARGVPAYLHPSDRPMLADPWSWISTPSGVLQGTGLTYAEPDDVRTLATDAVLSLAGLEVRVDAAPGHTAGSVLFRLPSDGADAEPGPQLCLTGDVLFAGSIGRTDLPGSSHPAMLHTLATAVLPLRDDTVVLPGHGPATTIGRERSSNPYLQDLAA